jgi:hypothetical protein
MGGGRPDPSGSGNRVNVCFVGTGRPLDNPRTMALIAAVRYAGNDVSLVCGGNAASEDPDFVSRVPSRIPQRRGRVGRLLRQVQPPWLRRRSFERRLAAAVGDLKPDIVYPVGNRALSVAISAAEAGNAVVARQPSLPRANDVDIIDRAPGDMLLSSSPAGPGSTHHTPLDDRDAWSPVDGRNLQRSIIMVFRKSEMSPGNYLRNAFERSGATTRHVESLDWSEVPADTACVVFVESLYPSLDVTGVNPGVPVLFWAHHGEHHTAGHLNLIERYQAHAVLLAHSWHLAHRYPIPVHRFPFAVPTESLLSARPWSERSFDIAFVGALHDEANPTYAKRRDMLRALGDAFPDGRTKFVEGISPSELAAIYGEARVVVNEGGARHYPITMRVFEAIGSGATLVTEPAPGLSQLFDPEREFVEMDIADPVHHVKAMLGNGSGRSIAKAGLTHAMERHTYDHRVDELLAIADGLRRGSALVTVDRPHRSPLASAVMDQAEVYSVACIGTKHLGDELPLHAVWSDPSPGSYRFDAVLIGSAATPEQIAAGCADAIRYVIVESGVPQSDDLDRLTLQPTTVSFTSPDGVTTVDLGAPGYRLDRRVVS